MKIIAAFLKATLLFTAIQSSAQPRQNDFGAYEVTVEDITKIMSKGQQPGFRVDIYQAEKKDVENTWSKLIRNETKSKAENVNNELFIPGTYLKYISGKPLNVYTIINQYEDHLEVNAFFELDSVFLTKENHETEYLAARKFVREFAVTCYRIGVAEEVKKDEKKLDGLEEQLDNLTNENDRLHKKISEENRNIDNDKEKIATSELDQERVSRQVQSDKEQLAASKSANAGEEVIKTAEKKLKDSENELSKLQRQEDNLHKDIDKSEENIREYERNIKDNEQNMELKRSDITQQKEFVYKLQKKLDSIR